MDVLYKTTSQRTLIKRYAKKAFENRVCFTDGLMIVAYNKPEEIKQISIAVVDGVVIGCALLCNPLDLARYSYGSDVLLNTYVKPSYRQHGIGTQLVKNIKRYSRTTFNAISHTPAGKNLYKKTAIHDSGNPDNWGCV